MFLCKSRQPLHSHLCMFSNIILYLQIKLNHKLHSICNKKLIGTGHMMVTRKAAMLFQCSPIFRCLIHCMMLFRFSDQNHVSVSLRKWCTDSVALEVPSHFCMFLKPLDMMFCMIGVKICLLFGLPLDLRTHVHDRLKHKLF